MKYRFLILIILTGWLIPALHVSAQLTQTKDSLLRVYLASPSDTTRLVVLYKLALQDQQSPTFIYYENKLLEEAIVQKNLHYQSAAIYGHVVYYYNKLDQIHTEQWWRRLEKLSNENNFYKHYFKGRKMLIELYIVNQKMELALKEAQEMYEKAEKLNNRNGMREAYLCLMTSYFSTMRYQEGISALNNAFALTESNVSAQDKMDLLCKASMAYSFLYDNTNLLKTLKLLEKEVNELLPTAAAATLNGYNNLYLLLELQYSLYYSRNKESEKAWKHLQKADKYLSPSSFLPYQLIRLTAHAEYYQLTQNYEKALDYWNEAITFASPLSPEDVNIYGLRKADLLVKMGHAEEALPLYKQITKAKDSLDTTFSSSQIEQIQSLYNMDKLVQQKEKREAAFHRICLAIAIATIIALILFNLHMYRGRRRLEQDEKEMRRLTNIAEEANEMKSRFLANMSYNIRIPLNNVVGFSQLLSVDTDLDEEERKEYSSIIQNNSNELIQLVNDVLDLSRLEANMMKFQLQNYDIEEWCSELNYTVKMRSEDAIRLVQQVETRSLCIHTDVNRLTQFVSNMVLYPNLCKESREVRMTITYLPQKKAIECRIENSPMADARFASQKMSVHKKINQLFFEHFGGSFQIAEGTDGAVGVITFTYPTTLMKDSHSK